MIFGTIRSGSSLPKDDSCAHTWRHLMKHKYILGIVTALLPCVCAYADEAKVQAGSAGAGSGQPGIWGQSMTGASSNRPMRPELKSSQQSVNHTNVQSTNATTSPSTSSSLSPSAEIKIQRVEGRVKAKILK